MIEWVRAFRLPVCFFAAGLAFAGFRIGGVPPLWSAVVAALPICCATMLQNDWRDRSHDGRKGKTLAALHPKAFLALTITMWSVSMALAMATAAKNRPIGGVLFGAILAGLAYSETRMIPMVPVLLVAAVSASPVLMAALAGAESARLWLLFLAAALVIFGREIIKDLDDFRIDGGYKWTIPLAAGEWNAKLAAAMAITAGSAIVLASAVAALPGAVLALIGAFFLLRYNERRAAKCCIDLGMALAIVAIGIWG